MNNDRRKTIAEIQKRLKALMTPEVTKAIETLVNLKSEVESIQNDIETVKDEEQESYDNMPESLQGGEKGEMVYQAITELEEAHGESGNLLAKLDVFEDMSEVDDLISNINGYLDNATSN